MDYQNVRQSLIVAKILIAIILLPILAFTYDANNVPPGMSSENYPNTGPHQWGGSDHGGSEHGNSINSNLTVGVPNSASEVQALAEEAIKSEEKLNFSRVKAMLGLIKSYISKNSCNGCSVQVNIQNSADSYGVGVSAGGSYSHNYPKRSVVVDVNDPDGKPISRSAVVYANGSENSNVFLKPTKIGMWRHIPDGQIYLFDYAESESQLNFCKVTSDWINFYGDLGSVMNMPAGVNPQDWSDKFGGNCPLPVAPSYCGYLGTPEWDTVNKVWNCIETGGGGN